MKDESFVGKYSEFTKEQLEELIGNTTLSFHERQEAANELSVRITSELLNFANDKEKFPKSPFHDTRTQILKSGNKSYQPQARAKTKIDRQHLSTSNINLV